MRRHRMLRACRMGRNQIPDYNPSDGSFRVGGGIAGSQDMVGQALDNVLTGFSPGWSDTHPAAKDGLGPLESMLYQVPLPVLKMFRPFTWGTPDADWDDQYTAVQDILKTFRPKTNLKEWFQEFIDSVSNMFGGADKNHSIKDAIDAIKQMLEVAQEARDSATNAQIGIAAINAAAKGGFHDEFDYPLSLAAALPGYTSFKWGPGGAGWAPSGKGTLTYRPGLGLASGQVFRRDSNPLPGNTGSMTVVVSKAPAADVLLPGSQGHVYVCVCFDAASQECVRFKVGPGSVALETVSAAGVATQVVSANLPHKVQAGDQLEAQYTATTVTFLLNKVSVLSQAYTQPAGRLVGFGGDCPTFGAAGALFKITPAPEFAGIAFHP